MHKINSYQTIIFCKYSPVHGTRTYKLIPVTLSLSLIAMLSAFVWIQHWSGFSSVFKINATQFDWPRHFALHSASVSEAVSRVAPLALVFVNSSNVSSVQPTVINEVNYGAAVAQW